MSTPIEYFCDSCHSEFTVELGLDQQESDIKYCLACGEPLDKDLRLGSGGQYDEGWNDPDLQ
jgi:hypothetical protein